MHYIRGESLGPGPHMWWTAKKVVSWFDFPVSEGISISFDLGRKYNERPAREFLERILTRANLNWIAAQRDKFLLNAGLLKEYAKTWKDPENKIDLNELDWFRGIVQVVPEFNVVTTEATTFRPR